MFFHEKICFANAFKSFNFNLKLFLSVILRYVTDKNVKLDFFQGNYLEQSICVSQWKVPKKTKWKFKFLYFRKLRVFLIS